jgi:toxin ParE1/3/4
LEAGEKLFTDFNKKCKNLAQYPSMGRSYSHIKSSLRGLPIDKGYIIIYQIIDDGVEILRVVNGRQDLESLFTDFGDS